MTSDPRVVGWVLVADGMLDGTCYMVAAAVIIAALILWRKTKPPERNDDRERRAPRLTRRSK